MEAAAPALTCVQCLIFEVALCDPSAAVITAYMKLQLLVKSTTTDYFSSLTELFYY